MIFPVAHGMTEVMPCYKPASERRNVQSRSAAGFALGVGAGPVLELVGVEFAVEVSYALRQPRLRGDDGLVVDGRADLFEEEIEQETCGHIADGLEVLFEVALHGSNGVGALLFGEFKCDHGPAPLK